MLWLLVSTIAILAWVHSRRAAKQLTLGGQDYLGLWMLLLVAACYLCWRAMGGKLWAGGPFGASWAPVGGSSLGVLIVYHYATCFYYLFVAGPYPAACATPHGWCCTVSGLGEASDIMNMSAMAICTASMMRHCRARLTTPWLELLLLAMILEKKFVR